VPDCLDAALPCRLSRGWPHWRPVVPCRGRQTLSRRFTRRGCGDLNRAAARTIEIRSMLGARTLQGYGSISGAPPKTATYEASRTRKRTTPISRSGSAIVNSDADSIARHCPKASRQGISVVLCPMLAGIQNARTAPSVRPNRLSANVSQVRLSLVLCFARYRGCIQVSFLNEIRAPAGVRTIYETSNLDACVMTPGPSAVHQLLDRLAKQLDQRAPPENVRIGNRLPATAL
jgi:hypothetical protein